MRDNKIRKKMVFPLLLIGAFAVSSGISYLYMKDKFAFESSFIADIESSSMREMQRQKKEVPMRLYDSDTYASARRRGMILRRDAMLVSAEDTIRQYLKSLSIRLLDLYMDRKGVIYIDVGGEIRKKFRGDVSEELSIIGGLYRNIKTTIPDLTALKILIDGRESESVGGHIDISRPIGEEIAQSFK